MNKVCLILFLFPLFFFTQNYTPEEIDEILSTEVVRLTQESKYKEALALSEKMKIEAKSIQYDKGEAWAIFHISNSYCNLANFQQSFCFLNNAKEKNKELKDKKLTVAISIGYGRNLNEQKLSYSLAIRQFKIALKQAAYLNQKEGVNQFNFDIYKNLISAYYNSNKVDSAYYYSTIAKKIKEDAYVLTSLTHYHLENSKNKDFIQYYLSKSTENLSRSPGQIYEKSILENQWGTFLFNNKMYSAALDHFKRASALAKKTSATDELLKSYLMSAQCYAILGHEKESLSFLQKEAVLKDSMQKAIINNLDESIAGIVSYNVEQETISKSFLIRVIIAVVVAIYILFLWKLKQLKNQKRTLLQEAKIALDKKETLLIEKRKQLEKNKNNRMEELFTLAKNNSPNFLTKFQEIYPDFCQKLVHLTPDLTTLELTFCAYILLGFETKDIAEYTFRSVKTIQNRKNKLRKRFAIPSDADLYFWFSSLICFVICFIFN